jgi:hypothetical protein
MIRFDHLRLVRRHPAEMKRFRSWILSAQPGDLGRVIIEHEPNDSCCQREPWNETARVIVEALQPAVPTVMLNMNPPEANEARGEW